jgi:hypothetical protein
MLSSTRKRMESEMRQMSPKAPHLVP